MAKEVEVSKGTRNVFKWNDPKKPGKGGKVVKEAIK